MTLDLDIYPYIDTKQMKSKRKNRLDFIEIKKLCASKNIINKVKRQLTEWDKIFANHITDKEILSRIYKNSNNSTIKKNPMKNMTNNLNDISPKKIISQ